MFARVQILRVIVKVITVVDDDSFFAVDHLNDAERTEFKAIRNVVLALDEQTALVLVHKLRQVVLNHYLVPLNSNASLRDGEARFFTSGLNPNLHDALLEECKLHVEMFCAILPIASFELGVVHGQRRMNVVFSQIYRFGHHKVLVRDRVQSIILGSSSLG